MRTLWEDIVMMAKEATREFFEPLTWLAKKLLPCSHDYVVVDELEVEIFDDENGMYGSYYLYMDECSKCGKIRSRYVRT
jgi:hypothetical protein